HLGGTVELRGERVASHVGRDLQVVSGVLSRNHAGRPGVATIPLATKGGGLTASSERSTGMTPGQNGRRKRTSIWHVPTSFAAVGLTAIILGALLVHDSVRGEGISHFGIRFMLELCAVPLLAVAVAFLPLLIVAVVIDRKARA